MKGWRFRGREKNLSQNVLDVFLAIDIKMQKWA